MLTNLFTKFTKQGENLLPFFDYVFFNNIKCYKRFRNYWKDRP